MIIARYDVILDQSVRALLYNHLSNYTNVILSPRVMWLWYWSTNFQNGRRAIFDVSNEQKKENAFALIITWVIILKQLFSSGSANMFSNYQAKGKVDNQQL